MPAWARKDGKKVLCDVCHAVKSCASLTPYRAAINISDDEDDDELDNEDGDDSLLIHRTPVAKKKKPANRSPSITPPPPVSVQQLQFARNLVRCANFLMLWT